MMKNNLLLLFLRNTLIAYILMAVISASYTLTESNLDIYLIGKTMMIGGGLVSIVTVWAVFKPTSRSHSNLGLTYFSKEYFLQKRTQDKPMEFVAFSILLACLLVAITGYIFINISV